MALTVELFLSGTGHGTPAGGEADPGLLPAVGAELSLLDGIDVEHTEHGYRVSHGDMTADLELHPFEDDEGMPFSRYPAMLWSRFPIGSDPASSPQVQWFRDLLGAVDRQGHMDGLLVLNLQIVLGSTNKSTVQ
jgi:hypothetical protein